MNKDTIRFALIGAGNVARIHAAAVAEIENAQISVVCNSGSQRGKTLAEQSNAVWLTDYEAAVKRADVDAVIICTPSGTHKEIAVAAASAGKHLLVEKPIEITLPRIDAMLDHIAKAGVHLQGVFQSRMRSGAQAAKQAVEQGRLGKLLVANAFVPWSRSAEYYETGWRGTWALDGGGALMNQSIHSVDLLQWLAGSVRSIFARTAAFVHDIETEDTATALLQFENGAQGVIQGMTSLYAGQPARVELHGSKGSVILEDGYVKDWILEDAADDETERLKNLDTWRGTGASDPNAVGYALHKKQIENFIAVLQGEEPNLISGSDARRSVEIIRAIYHSAKTNQPVSLPFNDTNS